MSRPFLTNYQYSMAIELVRKELIFMPWTEAKKVSKLSESDFFILPPSTVIWHTL